MSTTRLLVKKIVKIPNANVIWTPFARPAYSWFEFSFGRTLLQTRLSLLPRWPPHAYERASSLLRPRNGAISAQTRKTTTTPTATATLPHSPPREITTTRRRPQSFAAGWGAHCQTCIQPVGHYDKSQGGPSKPRQKHACARSGYI